MPIDGQDVVNVFEAIGFKSPHKNAVLSAVEQRYVVSPEEAVQALEEAIEDGLLISDPVGFLRKA